jgi:hypothetical protein
MPAISHSADASAMTTDLGDVVGQQASLARYGVVDPPDFTVTGSAIVRATFWTVPGLPTGLPLVATSALILAIRSQQRASSRLTCVALQAPPRVVGMRRSFRPVAIWRRDVAPPARSSARIPARSRA